MRLHLVLCAASLTHGYGYMYPIMRITPCWLPVLLLAASGCTSAPVQEMSDARQAVAAAKAVGASYKAPNVYNTATAHMNYAVWSLKSGDYEDAREHATWAKTHALEAHERALTRASRAR